jgi:hypothetical protein
MHGKVQPVLVLEIDTRSEKEIENDRLRDLARSSGRPAEEYSCDDVVSMDTMLQDFSGPMIERSADMVLFDHMGADPESSLFDESSRRRQGRAMGLTDDEIDMLSGKQMISEDMPIPEPKSMKKFKNDFKDLQKFGGDVVALEMDREAVDSMPMMTDMEMDKMLGSSMDKTSMMDMSDPMNQAMASLEEQFGRNAMAVLEGEADGYVVFSVDSPEMGQVTYIYDSKDGVGRVMRG